MSGMDAAGLMRLAETLAELKGEVRRQTELLTEIRDELVGDSDAGEDDFSGDSDSEEEDEEDVLRTLLKGAGKDALLKIREAKKKAPVSPKEAAAAKE